MHEIASSQSTDLHGSSSGINAARQWAATHANIHTIDILWDREFSAGKNSASNATSLRAQELFRVEWPSRWLHLVGKPVPEAEVPGDIFHTFISASVTRAGVEVLSATRSDEIKLFSRHESHAPIDSGTGFLLNGAPILLGRWLWDQRDLLEKMPCIVVDDSRIQVKCLFPPKFDFVLYVGAVPNESKIERITFYRSDGNPSLQLDYSNFRKVAGFDGLVPFERETTIFSTPKDLLLPESATAFVRKDFISSLLINKLFSEADFELSIEGFREDAAGKNSTLSNSSVPTASSQADSRSGMLWSGGLVVSIVMVIFALSIVFLRSRSK